MDLFCTVIEIPLVDYQLCGWVHFW